jgi:hypothetical protein
MDLVNKVLELVNWAVVNAVPFLTSVEGVLVSVIALCMMIPGEQPEKFLQGVVDFIAKFSRKPKV